MSDLRILVNARVTGPDGIGRYTKNLIRSLSRLKTNLEFESRLEIWIIAQNYLLNDSVDVVTLDQSKHYSISELVFPKQLQTTAKIDLLHCTDYRIPLTRLSIPIIVSIHDIFRFTHTSLCYEDVEFINKYGMQRFKEINLIIEYLKQYFQYNDVIKDSSQIDRLNKNISVPCHWKYYTLLLAWGLSNSKKILVPTDFVRQQIESAFSVRGSIEVIPYGINHFTEIEEGYLLENELNDEIDLKLFILYVGQSRKHKNIRKLLLAFHQVLKEYPHLELWLVGHDFSKDISSEFEANHCGLVKNVKLLGYVSDFVLGHLYQKAQMLVHLSIQEGFGFTPLESLKYRSPVVVADIPVMREVLQDHALFVDPDDEESIAAAIVSVMRKPYSKTEKESLSKYANNFRWESLAMAYYKSYLSARL